MRFFFSGPRIFGIRPGIILSPAELGLGRGAQRQAQAPVQGFVYVVSGAHGRVKIGITSNPAARLASLRTASPFPLKFEFIGAVQRSAFAVEQEAHRLLEQYHTDGEWFETSPEMAIAAVWGAAAKLGDKIIGLNEAEAAKTVALVESDGSPKKTVADVLIGLDILVLKVTGIFIFCIVVYILFQAV